IRARTVTGVQTCALPIYGRVAPEIAWQLHAGLGLARHAQGHDDDATRELRAALAEIERPSRSLTLPERRSAFLADKWDVYAQLALIERARGRADAAFAASERLDRKSTRLNSSHR